MICDRCGNNHVTCFITNRFYGKFYFCTSCADVQNNTRSKDSEKSFYESIMLTSHFKMNRAQSGIIRMIDELGRIVVPKDIRRQAGIHEGTELEVIHIADGEVLLRRHNSYRSTKSLLKLLEGDCSGNYELEKAFSDFRLTFEKQYDPTEKL